MLSALVAALGAQLIKADADIGAASEGESLSEERQALAEANRGCQ